MNIYRIRIAMPDGSKGHCVGLFANTFEAIFQTQADFPEAVSISAICLRRGSP